MSPVEPEESDWANDLARLISEHIWDAHFCNYVDVLDLRVVSPEELVIMFTASYLQPSPHAAGLRLRRRVIEANELLGFGRPLSEVALLVTVLALEEPRPLSDYEKSADGVYWLRSEAWLP